MALPNIGITSTMVKTALSAASHKWSVLCTHPNINKWSKWKPVRFDKEEGLTVANLASVNYGIQVNNYSGIDAVKAAYMSEVDVWTYLLPRGGQAGEPYRKGDFRNYEQNATPVVGGSTVTPFISNEDGSDNTIIASLYTNGNASDTELGWSDLALGGRRLGLALYDGATLVRSSVASVGESNVVINTRTPTVLPAKNYTAILFLSNTTGGTSSNIGGLPAQPPFGFIVQVVSGTGVMVTIRGVWDIEFTNTINLTVRASNKTVGVGSLLNCTIKVRDWQNGYSDTLETEEKQINIGTLTVPPLSSGEIWSGVTTVNRSAYSSWKLYFDTTGTWAQRLEGAILMVQPD